MGLREEVAKTQDSHQDYLSKLMGVLDTTQESRKTTSEEMILRTKDEEISNLKDEIARLRKAGAEASTANCNNDSKKKDAVKSMKYIVKKNREVRKSRVQQLGTLMSQLEQCETSSDATKIQQLLAS